MIFMFFELKEGDIYRCCRRHSLRKLLLFLFSLFGGLYCSLRSSPEDMKLVVPTHVVLFH